MRAVVQRVARGSVTIEGVETRRIGPGLVTLLGVRSEDTHADAQSLAEKIAHLRIFADGEERLNLSLKDTAGAALVVSNFTLYGDARKGRRPSFTNAAPPDQAELLYEIFVAALREHVAQVETGAFQAKMEVEIINDGPVTLLLDTEKRI